MADKQGSTSAIYNYETFKYLIKKLGSETKLKDLGLVCFLFVIGVILIAGSGVALVVDLFLIFENQEIVALIALITFCLGMISLFVSIPISGNKACEETRKKKTEVRKKLLKYAFLSYWSDGAIIEQSAAEKKTDIDELEADIKELGTLDSNKIADIDYFSEKFTWELKTIEEKKKTSIVVTLILTFMTSGFSFIENFVKVFMWSNAFTELNVEKYHEAIVDAAASGASLLFFAVIIFFVFNAKSTLDIGYSVQCRNLEYTLSALSDIKYEINQQIPEPTDNLSKIASALEFIGTNIIGWGSEMSMIKDGIEQQTAFVAKIQTETENIGKSMNDQTDQTKL